MSIVIKITPCASNECLRLYVHSHVTVNFHRSIFQAKKNGLKSFNFRWVNVYCIPQVSKKSLRLHEISIRRKFERKVSVEWAILLKSSFGWPVRPALDPFPKSLWYGVIVWCKGGRHDDDEYVLILGEQEHRK